MSARWLVSVVALGVVAGGCHSSSGGAACSDGPPCALDCGPGVDAPTLVPGVHVAEPTMITYDQNPPSSGPHWPVWQEPWGPYPAGLPRERWVHNLEHGGVVLAYNCPDGCDDVIAALTSLWQSTPPDQFNEQRLLVLPDGAMPHRVAAIAWGWRWQGETVDTAAIRCFIDARYDRAPESIP